jgi:electron transport complex protein RnfG
VIEQRHKKLLATLSSVIAPTRFDNSLALDCTIVTSPLLGSNKEQTIYLARMKGQPIAAAVTTVAPNGYNGAITLLVAVNYDGSVSGVRTLSHQETPGLGDKVELKKSTWITSFADKPLNDDNIERWAVVKDGGMFDQFTGATITPRAVVNAVKKATLYVQNNKEVLFNAPNTCKIEAPIPEAPQAIPLESSVETSDTIKSTKVPNATPTISDKPSASESTANE